MGIRIERRIFLEGDDSTGRHQELSFVHPVLHPGRSLRSRAASVRPSQALSLAPRASSAVSMYQPLGSRLASCRGRYVPQGLPKRSPVPAELGGKAITCPELPGHRPSVRPVVVERIEDVSTRERRWASAPPLARGSQTVPIDLCTLRRPSALPSADHVGGCIRVRLPKTSRKCLGFPYSLLTAVFYTVAA
jgi:hypothetical protein